MAGRARQLGYSFQFHAFAPTGKRNRRKSIRDLVRDTCCAGLVIYVFSRYDDITGTEPTGIPCPCVALGDIPESVGIDCICVDNRAGGFAATEHLIGIGRRRIGFISGPADSIDSTQRFRGFHEALLLHGLALDERLVQAADFTIETGYAATEAMLQASSDAPDGIFCANDRIARGAIGALRDAGLRVPVDVSLVGFDDTIADAADPALTTVRQPLVPLGERTIDVLAGRIMDPKRRPGRLALAPELVIRDSCGARVPAETRSPRTPR